MVPKAGLDALKKRKFSCPRRSSPYPVTIMTELALLCKGKARNYVREVIVSNLGLTVYSCLGFSLIFPSLSRRDLEPCALKATTLRIHPHKSYLLPLIISPPTFRDPIPV
jgi:hypothetical protein